MFVINLFEADPIDFEARRQKKAADKVPDSLKFRGAVAKQQHEQGQDPPPADVSDLARQIILRNLDKIFSGEPLPKEDRDQLKMVLKVNDMVTVMFRRQLVQEVLKLYRKEHKVTVYKHYPSDEQAYLKDDPSLTKWRLQIGDDIHSYDTEFDLDAYVLTTLLTDAVSWSDEDKKKLERVMAHLKQPPTDDEEDPKKPFDPMQRRLKYDDTPDETEIIPAVVKYLQRFDLRDDDKPYWISVKGFNWETHKWDEYALQFSSRHAPPRIKRFASLQELEHWVLSHKAGIETWYARQNSIQHSDTARIRLAVRKTVAMIREVLSGNADPEKIRKETWHLRDHVTDQIANDKVREFLQTCSYDLANQKFWNIFTDYHITWLPEHIAELLNEP